MKSGEERERGRKRKELKGIEGLSTQQQTQDHLPFLPLPVTAIHPLVSGLQQSDSALNQSFLRVRSLCPGKAETGRPQGPAALQ